MITLTDSATQRQNVLNNQYALEQVRQHLDIGGTPWEGDLIFTKAQVAEILEVDERTVERYLSSHAQELTKNGYRILRGKLLQNLRSAHVSDIHVGDKTPFLGIFSFRAVLNLAMLVQESERAKAIRSRILDIVIDVMAKRTGGSTKYINQRDEGYLLSDFQQKTYRKTFIAALEEFVEDFKYKNATYTNKVYTAVFKEDAREYRKILQLKEEENPRDTMYAEVLDLLASFESGLAFEIEKKYKTLGRKLTSAELKEVFTDFAEHPVHAPLILKVRTKMASRDLCFRDALHDKLEEYIQSVPAGDFDRFLGEKSKELSERLEETKDVFKRLKDR